MDAASGPIADPSQPAPAEARRIGFVLVDRFSMISLTAAVEPLRAANMKLGRDAYRWRLIAPGAMAIPSSSGLTLHTDLALEDVPERLDEFDALLVVTGSLREPDNTRAITSVLRRADRRG
ncbi:MAG: GlxA family transcriptional regulator, partial [Pseudomonadota bacterium]